MKKVTIVSKPPASASRRTPDQWVRDTLIDESMKRLTIDVPLSLHKRIKTQCAMNGDKMADVIRDLLEKHFDQEHQNGGEGDAASN